MADFDNLLGEINAIEDDETINDIESISQQEADNNSITTPPAGTTSIPPALLEAENRRQSNDEPMAGQPATEDYNYENELDNDNNNDDDDNENGENGQCRPDPDYETLQHLWIQELNCTELLPYDDNTTSVLLEVLSHQEDTMDQLQEQAGRFSGSGSGTLNSSSGRGSVDPSLASLAAGICKMDSDRLGFVMADLMRTRLFKIEKYALHNRDVLDRMSQGEVRDRLCREGDVVTCVACTVMCFGLGVRSYMCWINHIFFCGSIFVMLLDLMT